MKIYGMKKFIALCTAIALFAVPALCGCFAKGEDTDNGADAVQASETVKADKENGEDIPQAPSKDWTQEPEPYVIGISFPSRDSSFYAAMMDYCDRTYPSARCEVICYGSDNDQDTQNATIDTMLGQGYDGIILIPATPEGAVPAVKKCNEKNVPVIILDRMVASEDCTITAHVGTDHQVFGRAMAESMLKGLEEKLPGRDIYNIAELVGREGSSDSLLVSNGIAEVLEESPRVNMLAVLDCEASGATAQTVARDCFEAYDKLDGFICHDDDLALGCISAFREVEEKPENLVICSFGGSLEACKAVESGDMYSTVRRSPEMAGTAVELLCDYLDGNEIDSLVYSPAEAVDSKNAGAIIEEGNTY